MKRSSGISLIVIVLLLLISGLNVQAKVKTGIFGPTFPSGDDPLLIGSRIDIAVWTNADEQNPAVATCGNYTLVVFERDGGIYAQRLDNAGGLIGTAFEVYRSGTNESFDPDVACLDSASMGSAYFIVVWTYDFSGNFSDTDVYAKAVPADPAGGNAFGSYIYVSNSYEIEGKASIACEEDDIYCLVAFEKVDGADPNVKGQRLSLIIGGIGLFGDQFDPYSGSDTDVNPDVTWGKTCGEYLFAWQGWEPDWGTGNYAIFYATIYEDEQGTGVVEVKSGPYHLTWPYPTTEYDQLDPAVAFSPISGYYLVSFTGLHTSMYDVRARFFTPGIPESEVLIIESGSYGSTALAFSGGPYGGAVARDEFLALYTKFDIVTYELFGQMCWKTACKSQNPKIEDVTSPNVIYNQDITGYSSNGTYLVVWEQEIEDGGGYDIYGQRVNHNTYYDVFQPLVIK